MDSQKQQIVEKLTSANNILLTVSRDPSVDQLAACIALTILLNKMDKHATAVFSGKVPSTIDFLKPDETLEKNTDSLRDFIIALDKSKADKLRYKVEDRVVKIFITPYKTSLTSDDLEFSQGDFNVDVVLALGVHQQVDLDDAITAHGRILHDATVMCINTTPNGDLGGVNWVGQKASSLSEMATELAKSFEKPQLDEQIATALLTGIVAETDRFKNDKTTANTMSLSSDLMKAGANQQLVADELEQTVRVRDQGDSSKSDDQPTDPDDNSPKKDQDGTLEINHPADTPKEEDHTGELPPPVDDDNRDDNDQTPLDQPDRLDTLDFSRRTMLPDSSDEAKSDDGANDEPANDSPRSLITEPPTFGAALTANTQPDNGDLTNIGMPATEPEAPLIERENHLDKTTDKEPVHAEAPEQSVSKPDEPPMSPPAVTTSPQPSFEPVFSPPKPSQPEPRPSIQPPVAPLPPAPAPTDRAPMTPPVPASAPALSSPTPSAPEPPHRETLTELEEAVKSPHVDEPETKEPAAADTSEIDKARDEVMRALNEQPSNLPPIEALNAQPVDLGNEAPTPESPATPAAPQPVSVNPPEQAPFSSSPADKPLDMPLPPSITLPPAETQSPTNSPNDGPDSPPPVPPPFLPGNFGK
jgi:hypothetical protein